MNLVDYARILVRRGWLMVLLAVLAAAAAFLFSQQLTPIYRATQKVLMNPSRSDWGLTQAAVQLLNNRREYLDSDLVAASIIDQLNLDMLPGDLRSRTTISTNRDSLIIQIDVDHPDPALATQVASAWGQELILYQQTLNQEALREDRIRAQIQDNAQVGLYSPNTRINALIGAVGGFLLGAILIFILEFLESNVVRRRDDMERALGMKVLASVPSDLI